LVDIASIAYPTPLVPENPLGSLIYDPIVAGDIGTAGDIDIFTISVDSGQTITVLVTPTSAGLQPSVQLLDSTSTFVASASASAAGQDALLQTISIATGGTYSIVISGASSAT